MERLALKVVATPAVAVVVVSQLTVLGGQMVVVLRFVVVVGELMAERLLLCVRELVVMRCRPLVASGVRWVRTELREYDLYVC